MTKPIKKALILAAGWGTRLLPATKSIAKPMLPIVDRPAIDYIIQDLVDAGIRDIIIVGKQNFDQIESYLDRHLELEHMLEGENKTSYLEAITKFKDIHFTFVRQGQMGGPGDAVMAAHHLIDDEEAVIVYYSDDIAYPRTCIQSMIEQYKNHPGCYVTLQKAPLEKIHHYGVVAVEHEVSPRLKKLKLIVEKPTASEAPSQLAVMTPNIITKAVIDILARRPKLNKKDHSVLTQAIGGSIGVENVYGYEAEELWVETGNKLGLLKAQVLFGLADPSIQSEFKSFLKETVNQS